VAIFRGTKEGKGMLKSELIVSEDMELLDSHLKHYSAQFITPIFSDENKLDPERYKRERGLVITDAASNPQEARNFLIPAMIENKDLFGRVQGILHENKEWAIDPMVMQNAMKQMDELKRLIENSFIAARLTDDLINGYYEGSLKLLIYFSSIRAHIKTLRDIGGQFGLNAPSCRLRFFTRTGESLSIVQIKEILNFLELACLHLGDLLEIFSIDIDTGTPRLNIDLRSKIDITADLREPLKTHFFGFIFWSVIFSASLTQKSL
jgi:hypothetical protein